MDLPRELRDMIYYHALVPLNSVPPWLKYKEQDPIRLGIRNRLEWNRLKRDMTGLGMAFPKTYPEISPRINTALFCTNHTLRAEAEAVFYKHNTFTMHASWFRSGTSKARRPLPAAALSKLRKLYVRHWDELIKERARSTRVAPVQMDEAREAQIKAVGEAQGWHRPLMRYVMDEMRVCDVWTDYLAALPVLRELTIDFKPWSLYRSQWNDRTEGLVVGRLYDKMKERPDLGLPPVRVHLCRLAMGDPQSALEWSQWCKPSDCIVCTSRSNMSDRGNLRVEWE